ncbi:MAG: diacylglycerol kinase family lipid kinase [Planctomycetaceae bacterium]|nr:diacylglycerol kinase family lipid kinase [Planctomycetaceae bacterium]
MTNDQRRKFCLVVNPFGGKQQGLAILESVKPIFDAASVDLEVIRTTHPRHAYDVANTKSFSDFEGMIVIGGDGTIHEVINGMMDRADKITFPLGLIPGGSGNSFLTDLEVLDPISAAEAIVSGRRRLIDVAKVTLSDRSLYAFNIIGWGLVADVNVRAEKYRWMGPVRYTVASLVELVRAKKRAGTLRFNDREINGEFCFVLACNTIHTGKQMKMAPRATLDDGLIDLVVVKHGPGLFKMLSLFSKLYDGNYIHDPAVEYHQVNRFVLNPDIAGPLNVDGELLGKTPAEVVMLPAAFEVYCDLGT